MSIIEINNLSYIYMKGTPYESQALKNVSLSVEKGEVLAIIGPTGCGKSTLVKHLNGLIKPEPGTVIVDGSDIGEKGVSLKDLRRRVGLVFQYPEYQLFEETVAGDIAFGPEKFGFSEDEVKSAVREAMEEMGLDASMSKRSPFSLSGGEMRRVAIAGVIASRPSVLVLDEPSAGLDPVSAERLTDMIINLNRKKSVTVVIVSHSMDEVIKIADRIALMNEGSIIASGTPEDVFSSEEVFDKMRLFLPQSCSLLVALKERGLPVRTNICDSDGCVQEILAVLSGIKHADNGADNGKVKK